MLGFAAIVKSGEAARIRWPGVADGTAKTVPVQSISRESTNVTILKNHTTVVSFRIVLEGLSVSVAAPKENKRSGMNNKKKKKEKGVGVGPGVRPQTSRNLSHL